MARKTAEEVFKTRQALLDSALDLFASQGFETTSLVDIAQKSGFTRGAIHSQFEKKADLLIYWIEHYEKLEMDSIQEILNTFPAEPQRALEQISLLPWKMSQSKPQIKDILKVLFLDRVAQESLLDEGIDLQAGAKQDIQFIKEFIDQSFPQSKWQDVSVTMASSIVGHNIGMGVLWLEETISYAELVRMNSFFFQSLFKS